MSPSFRNLLLVTALFGAFLVPEAYAKKFRTDFISLELPPGWDCAKEEIDWVCQPENLAQRSETLVAIVAKAANATDDTFEKYHEVLGQPREMRDLTGKIYKSDIKFVRFRDIKEQKWIDSLTFGSEIPGFYTRYVASIKGKVAGLVTYSIAESVYAKWAPILDKMLDSLEIFYDPKAFNEAMASGPSSLLGQRPGTTGRFQPATDDQGDAAKKDGGLDMGMLAGVIVIAGIVAFYIWKKKKDSEQG
ncbi:MAG: hypothetical protein ABIR96_04010 [Bdellovibrionota bacterium]